VSLILATPWVLPHLTKGFSHLFGEERWLFERSEMPTFVEFVPIAGAAPPSLAALAATLLFPQRRNGA